MNWRLVTFWAPLGLLATGLVLAFEVPTDSAREKAVGSLAGLDPSLQRAFRNEGEYRAKVAPGASDWLASHKEEGQDYQQWLDSRPNLPSGDRRKLYIFPLGDFDETAPDIGKLQRYAAAYFYPMKVRRS